MTMMEITVVAELNAELRRAAFKANFSAATVVLDQILRVIQEESDYAMLQIHAIRSNWPLGKNFSWKGKESDRSFGCPLSIRKVDVAIEVENGI
ncbi:Armadillo [Melia azedarach]|uniref:Armadillo n=1 Tax=Melia azedarach TaxID=155640 RepID=A0ACC1X257_MELAZ|nr:Armadillo [Melia azedarach]